MALPELWNCHGLEDVYRENSEPVPGPTTKFLGGLAGELGVYLLGVRSSRVPNPRSA